MLDGQINTTDDPNEILYFSINQDNNCIAVGTKSGFKIFSTDPFQLFYENRCGPISIVEMLYTTNLILLVSLVDFGDFSPRKVSIWCTKQNNLICSSWNFQGKIIIAKINKKRMIICERNFMHVYTTGNMKMIHSIDIGNVSLGKLALSPSSDKNNFVVYSSNVDEGIVKVYDLLFLAFKVSIKAHKSPVLKLSLNSKADLLATCSCKGTIMRIFSLPKGEKLFTFKRGISSAYIFCLSFSLDNMNLISTSDTGTLHIFDLSQDEEQLQQKRGIIRSIKSFFSSLTMKIIPRDYEDYIINNRSILSTSLEVMKSSNLTSFNPKSNKEAYCFTSDGTFNLFNISYENKSIQKVYECNMKDLNLIV